MSNHDALPRSQRIDQDKRMCPRDRRDAIALRLDESYQRIDHALGQSGDVFAWEDFWIHLLREYEAVCNELGEAA